MKRLANINIKLYFKIEIKKLKCEAVSIPLHSLSISLFDIPLLKEFDITNSRHFSTLLSIISKQVFKMIIIF